MSLVFAEILLVLGAVETHATGRRVESNDSLTLAEAAHASAKLLDGAGEFVSEQGRWNDHPGVVSALVDLQIRATGERDVNLDENFAVANAWNGNLLDLDILFSVEDCRRHLSVHSQIPSLTLPGWIAIFIVSGFGWAAKFNASTACWSGNLWLYSEAKSIS